jgi:hypothetical protein
MIRARDLPDEGEFPWDPHCAGVVFEPLLPLPQEEVLCKLSPFERYATDALTGGNSHTVLCVMNPRRRVAQLTVAIGRNHRGHVLETDPSVLQETLYVVWDLSRGDPTRVQKRSRLAIDPDLNVGDISGTYPDSYVLRLKPNAKKRHEIMYNEQVTTTPADLARVKREIKLLAQVFTADKPCAAAVRHPEQVAKTALWMTDRIRCEEGKLGLLQEGYVREKIPRTIQDAARPGVRVTPAPLRALTPNVVTGVTAANLRLYASRKVPRIQRTETEIQAELEQAYEGGIPG